MSFKFQLDTHAGVQHLTLTGHLDSATFVTLEKTINGLFSSAGDRVLMDLSALSYISSAGLRLMVVAAKRARQVGGQLILCGLSPTVRDVFEISGFLKIMATTETKAEAERALQT